MIKKPKTHYEATRDPLLVVSRLKQSVAPFWKKGSLFIDLNPAYKKLSKKERAEVILLVEHAMRMK